MYKIEFFRNGELEVMSDITDKALVERMATIAAFNHEGKSYKVTPICDEFFHTKQYKVEFVGKSGDMIKHVYTEL